MTNVENVENVDQTEQNRTEQNIYRFVYGQGCHFCGLNCGNLIDANRKIYIKTFLFNVFLI